MEGLPKPEPQRYREVWEVTMLESSVRCELDAQGRAKRDGSRVQEAIRRCV